MHIVWVCLLLAVPCYSRSSCEQVSFVDRAGWRAREPTSITNLTGKPLSYYVIHHTYEPPNCYDDASCIERVQWIQDFHQINRSWVDIGYHFLVGENGKVYEGRGWNRQGAHAPEWNSDAFGICIIGDFTVGAPNEAALNTARLWIECGVELGHVQPVHYIITHRQSQRPGYTECPGDGAFNVVKTWPRFCSFQNPGANRTQNGTLPDIARPFCEQELRSSSSAPSHMLVFLLLPHLLLVFFL